MCPPDSSVTSTLPELILGRSIERSYDWSERDVLLYALGVGAGQGDPARELHLTTENSEGHPLRVIPTFGSLMTQDTIGLGTTEVDPTTVVHAEQALELLRPIPLHGTAVVRARVAEVLDKGSGALVVTEADAVDAATGEGILSTRSAVFVRGAGGFGGPRVGSHVASAAPVGRPERVLSAPVRSDQALLYRLSGDRNPLHSDPAFARRAGFERPILHGLATFGITGRMLFTELCDSDPGRFRTIEGRFTAPVLPGDQLRVAVWGSRDDILFRTENDAGLVVLDRGRLRLRG